MTRTKTAAKAAPALPSDVVPVPLADLYLSPLNPRQEHDPEGIAALAESLRACGLLQNLAGLPDEAGRVGIVAGGRRLAALQLAAETHPNLATVPVRMAPDEATAELWALAENTARASLHMADEVRAYRRMAEGGTPLPAVASAFAVTEAHVRRRLKLASLPEPILDALKAGQIGAGHAQAFTLCADEGRALDVLAEVVRRRLGEDSLRRILTQERVPHDDRRAVFVGLAAYEEAGGTLTRDLFSPDDEAFLDDPALLDRLFAERLAAEAESRRAQGWRWVEAHPESHLPWDAGQGLSRVYPMPADLPDDDEAELAALYEAAETDELTEEGHARIEEIEAARPATFDEDQRGVAGGWVYVDRDGDLCEALGFIRPEDRAAAVALGVIDAPRRMGTGAADGEAAPPKGPYSAALLADLRAVRLAAVQTALLGRPDLVLDLLAFAVSPESGWGSRPLAVEPERQPIEPKGEDDALVPDPRLTEGWPATHGVDDLAAAFDAFRAKGSEHRDAALAQAFARTLRYGAAPDDRERALFEQVEREAGAQVRAVWRPTGANFLGRVSGAVLDGLFRDLLERTEADTGFKAFKGMRKSDKVAAMDRLFNDPDREGEWIVTPAQRARIDAWAPPIA